jgi:hypothetical protein
MLPHQIIGWADEKKTKLKFKRDDAMLVYGGDSQDKGIGDIRFTKLLLALKKEYPHRVEFIIGNRDANKLRLATELHQDTIKNAHVLTDVSFPYWVDEKDRVTPQMYLDKNDAQNGGSSNNAANRLRWMLDKTMGAEGAFERRRIELSEIRQCEKEEVTDDEVVDSYRNEVDPDRCEHDDNFMLQYLKEGKLAYVFGSNLFVHGAIDAETKGTVPGVDSPYVHVHQWVKALNEWKQGQLDDFEADPKSGTNTKDRKGFGLMDYGVPGGNHGSTIVYNHFLDNGNAQEIPHDVQEYLMAGHIKTVLAGHQPHGDCPCVIRSGQVTVITSDTSYSHFGHAESWGKDNRGPNCVNEVVVYRDGTSEVHGLLADGTKFAYKLAAGARGGDKFVGRQLSDGFWVKAR